MSFSQSMTHQSALWPITSEARSRVSSTALQPRRLADEPGLRVYNDRSLPGRRSCLLEDIAAGLQRHIHQSSPRIPVALDNGELNTGVGVGEHQARCAAAVVLECKPDGALPGVDLARVDARIV